MKPPRKGEFTPRWTTDAHGNRVLHGLDVEETKFHEAYLRSRTTDEQRRRSGEKLKARRLRFLELHEKHELARRQAIDADAKKSARNPKIG